MKRTPLKRKTGLKRHTRLRQRNPERRARMHARNFGDRAKRVREMGCLAHDPEIAWGAGARGRICEGDVQAAHVVARGMGGCGGDRRELVPLCARHHEEAGERRGSAREDFEAKYGLDLQAEARRIAEQLDAEGLP